jgi:hypothetical protein
MWVMRKRKVKNMFKILAQITSMMELPFTEFAGLRKGGLRL